MSSYSASRIHPNEAMEFYMYQHITDLKQVNQFNIVSKQTRFYHSIKKTEDAQQMKYAEIEKKNYEMSFFQFSYTGTILSRTQNFNSINC